MLKSLEHRGLVEIRQGKGGGVRLGRSPSSITLADIYTAVETDAEIFAYHEAEPNPACIVSCRMKQVLEPAGAAALAAVLAGRIPIRDGERVAVVLSGGNVAVDRLGELLAGAGALPGSAS